MRHHLDGRAVVGSFASDHVANDAESGNGTSNGENLFGPVTAVAVIDLVDELGLYGVRQSDLADAVDGHVGTHGKNDTKTRMSGLSSESRFNGCCQYTKLSDHKRMSEPDGLDQRAVVPVMGKLTSRVSATKTFSDF